MDPSYYIGATTMGYSLKDMDTLKWNVVHIKSLGKPTRGTLPIRECLVKRVSGKSIILK